MAVIVWVNGAFGVGKTTTVTHLHPLLARSHVFGPEIVGSMLPPALADHPVADFQHWPPWRHLVIATATQITTHTGQHLICPQTVLTRAHLDQIRTGLEDAGHHVHHVLLDAKAATLRSRIEASDEAVAWRLDHVEAHQQARPWLLADADLVVDVDTAPPATVAATIAQHLHTHGLDQT